MSQCDFAATDIDAETVVTAPPLHSLDDVPPEVLEWINVHVDEPPVIHDGRMIFADMLDALIFYMNFEGEPPIGLA